MVGQQKLRVPLIACRLINQGMADVQLKLPTRLLQKAFETRRCKGVALND